MGRARKTNKQKSDAKQANDRNMRFMENLQQQSNMPASETKPKMKRGTSMIPILEPSKIESDVAVEDAVGSVANSKESTCDIELDVPEDLTVNLKAVPETKPKKKRGTSMIATLEPTQIESDVAVEDTGYKESICDIELDVPEDLTVNLKADPAVAVLTDVPENLTLDSAAIPVQPTFAGRNVSVIKVVLDCDENADAIVNENFVMEAPDRDAIKDLEDKVAALSLEVDSLKRENARLRSLNEPGENQVAAISMELESFKRENAKLRSLNMRLQEALIERPNGIVFTEVPGFPDAKWLLSVSQNAQDSDYLFVKELVFRLFPLGVGNATVSGYASNNPLGRGSRNGLQLDARSNVDRLDQEKVKYIRDRLHERRLILQDELGVAVQRSRKTARHIAAVINNNPSLRTLRQQ